MLGSRGPKAIARMQRALQELEIDGVQTTREFHLQLIGSPDFAQAKIHTRYIQDTYLKQLAEARKAS